MDGIHVMKIDVKFSGYNVDGVDYVYILFQVFKLLELSQIIKLLFQNGSY